jgi:hypothetical protein
VATADQGNDDAWVRLEHVEAPQAAERLPTTALGQVRQRHVLLQGLKRDGLGDAQPLPPLVAVPKVVHQSS